MLQRALGQEVYHPAATRGNPFDALAAIDKAQYLDTLKESVLLGIGTDLRHSLMLALRDACRSHFDAIDIDIGEQFAGHHQLLVRQERYAIGLLTIAQRGVHNLDEGRNTLIGVYLLRCSHASVFC